MGGRRYTDLQLYGRLLRQARPCCAHLGWLLALSLLTPCVKLLAPLPLKVVVDSVLGDHPPPALPAPLGGGTGLLVVAAGLVVAIALAGHLLGLAANLLSTYAG